jgi:transcriptional regulator with XRE-family HTH domain
MCNGSGRLATLSAPPLSVMADRLREAIQAKGFTQTDVAVAINRTQTAVSYWTRALREPSRDDLFALAGVLDVDVAWLMGLDTVTAPLSPKESK